MQDGRRRIVIEGVVPQIDEGRFPCKRTVGDLVHVEADVLVDGHDLIAAQVLYRPCNTGQALPWSDAPMRPTTNDRWAGEFRVTEIGLYRFTIRGWVDHFETWRSDLPKRIAANTDARVDYMIGADLIAAGAERAIESDAAWLRGEALFLRSVGAIEGKRARATADVLSRIMAVYPDHSLATQFERELEIRVDPVRARFSSWYELFPRSTASEPGRHGTFADVEARLPYVAGMGFDVLYLPPIHPIGIEFRKGPNNAPHAGPNDEGSPWAIGGPEGGHKSIHPKLGTLADFKRLVRRASELGIELALDIAFQVSPDHPYVAGHEDWFRKRPDGTIQYAENPPKKYQDIYPFDFESHDWMELWKELKSVFVFWAEQGVRIFRVDNPHTKPFPFWEWLIAEIKRDWPDAMFLAEAFTRPKIMYRLAKLGFSQSYTYFPWRNAKHEIISYLNELTKTEVREYFRPNQWPNTPDILTDFLQQCSRAAFMARLVLAATLGASYGIYGPAFELMECKPKHPGSEEYLDSEKYEVRRWGLERPDSLRDFIALVNRIRLHSPALHNDWTLEFHPVNNDQLIAYSKRSPDGADLIVVVVNLDPHRTQSGFVELPLEQLHIESHRPYQAHDLLTNSRYSWSGPRNYVELNPESVPAHILRIRHGVRTEADFEYFL